MDIESLRNEIDKTDDGIVELFKKRMRICGDVAEYKKQNNKPVCDSQRERELLKKVEKQGEEFGDYTKVLFSTIMDLSRSYQYKCILPETELMKNLKKAAANILLFPTKAVVACQGIEGAYSQLACEKLFKSPEIMYFGSFEGVFQAVDKGLCRYGILPLENSTAGSVNMVYDLMSKYKFYISKSVRLHIGHSLLAKRGTELKDIREIFSHEQAINQCSEFLKDLKNVKITVCENTATAAKAVADSERNDIAAIASKNCTELYNLVVIPSSIQNTDSNYTRFICISKTLEIYPGADKTSMILTLPHKPGSLYRIMSMFYTRGINITKLESRPIPGKDFEFLFYFDVESSVYSDEFTELIKELENLEQFTYLGTYSEIF